MELTSGATLFQRFEVIRELRAAPLCRIVRARDPVSADEVELWLPHARTLPTDASRRRFVENALQVQAMTAGSGHLRRLVDAGDDGERCWVAAALAAGQSLAERVGRGRPATDAVVAYVAMSLAEGLTAAHIAKLVHGYLRAEDVVMAGELPRIGGVGLWHVLDRTAALEAFRSSSHLLAPEVRAGEPATTRSDVYSLAVILAELALGIAAESGAEAAVLRDRLRRERVRLAGVLGPAFTVAPGERPVSASTLAAELADLVPRPLRRTLGSTRDVTPATGRLVLGGPASGAGDDLGGDSEGGAHADSVAAADAERDDRPFDEVSADPTVQMSSFAAPVMTLRGGVSPPGQLPRAPSVYPRSSEQVSALASVSGGAPAAVPAPALTPPITSGLRAVALPPPTTGQEALPRRFAVVLFGGIATLLAVAVAMGSWHLIIRARGGGASGATAITATVGPRVTQVVVPAAADEQRAAASGLPTGAHGAPAGAGAAAGAPDATPVVAPLTGPCPAEMVLAEPPGAGRYCIDRYEGPGVVGQRPALGLTFEAAVQACAAGGKRLCTGVEWEAACRGASRASYPYGGRFVAAPCNVRGKGVAAVGEFMACVSASGAHDMSGNAAEWVSEHMTRGGSFWDGDDGRCSHRWRRPAATPRADVGYRCCRAPSP